MSMRTEKNGAAFGAPSVTASDSLNTTERKAVIDQLMNARTRTTASGEKTKSSLLLSLMLAEQIASGSRRITVPTSSLNLLE